jgi:ribosomal protein S18 acetylase RimI-like enzyme
MNIRLAEKLDIGALVEFNQAMALETESRELDENTLRTGVESVFADPTKGFYVVADDGGQIAGGLLVTFEWSDWRAGWFWWIQSVYIRQQYRGRSIYRSLYDFVKRLADQRGDVSGFRLYVEKENRHAQRVYEKLGMVKTYYLMYEELQK